VPKALRQTEKKPGKRVLEKTLREAGLSRKEAKAMVAYGCGVPNPREADAHQRDAEQQARRELLDLLRSSE